MGWTWSRSWRTIRASPCDSALWTRRVVAAVVAAAAAVDYADGCDAFDSICADAGSSRSRWTSNSTWTTNAVVVAAVASAAVVDRAAVVVDVSPHSSDRF